jgi:hypothetical protein
MKRAGVSLRVILLTVFICIAIPISVSGSDKLIIKDMDGATTFKVEDDGAISAVGKLLVQRPDHGTIAAFFRQTDGDAEIQIGQSTDIHKAAVIGFNQAGAYYYMSVYGLEYNRLVFNSSGYLGVGTTSPEFIVDVKGGAYCDGSAWYNASSREYKTDIKQLTTEKAMDAFTKLNPIEFAYKTDSQEKHVGFIAEDVPELVASKGRKGMSAMDVVAVLTKVVQEQQATIAELSRRLAEVEKR